MKIGIVSNAKICIPLLSYLAKYNKAGVALYLGRTNDPGVNMAEIAGFCNGNHIAIHIENKKEELYQWQQLFEPDIIFVAGYSNKIDVGNLKGVPQGVYNIHFGKLPEFRGPSPVFWQLKKGMPEIGLTIHQLSEKFDSGDVVWEYFLKNEDHHNYNYVNYLFSELQIRGVLELLERVNRNELLKKRKQDEGKAKYYKKPQLADVMINWEEMEAKEIINLVKACNAWNIGASTIVNGFELKIMDANIITEKMENLMAGTIIIDHNFFRVACIKNVLLSVNFFNINQTYIASRYAQFYGLKTGQQFQSKL